MLAIPNFSVSSGFNFLRAVARSIKTTNITAKAAWDGLSETAEKAGKSIRGGVEAIKPMAGQAFKHVVVGGQTAGRRSIDLIQENKY